MRFSTVTFVALAALLATSTARDVKSFERRVIKRGIPTLPVTSNSYDGSSYGGEGNTSGSSSGSGSGSDDYDSGSGGSSGTNTGDDYDSGSGGSSGSSSKHPTGGDDYDSGSGSSSGTSMGNGDDDYDNGSGSGSSSGSAGSSGSWTGSADCEYDSDGYLTGVRKSGCPYQITIKGNGATKCKFNNKGKLLTVDALNCSNICVLSKTCPQQQNCDIENSGTIVVSALSCSNISVLSGLLRK